MALIIELVQHPVLLITKPLPTCEASIIMTDHLRRWKLERKKGLKCERKAHYDIDGTKLCRQHAGFVALRLLLELQRIDDRQKTWREITKMTNLQEMTEEQLKLHLSKLAEEQEGCIAVADWDGVTECGGVIGEISAELHRRKHGG